MKTKAITLCLVLASCGVYIPEAEKKTNNLQSLGGLAGRWQASQVTDTIAGVEHTCESTFFDIEKAAGASSLEAQWTLRERVFLCANKAYETRWKELVLTEKQGKLFQNGLVVGDIADNYLNADVSLGGAVMWRISISVLGNVLKYTESVTGGAKTSAVLKQP